MIYTNGHNIIIVWLKTTYYIKFETEQLSELKYKFNLETADSWLKKGNFTFVGNL